MLGYLGQRISSHVIGEDSALSQNAVPDAISNGKLYFASIAFTYPSPPRPRYLHLWKPENEKLGLPRV